MLPYTGMASEELNTPSLGRDEEVNTTISIARPLAGYRDSMGHYIAKRSIKLILILRLHGPRLSSSGEFPLDAVP